MLQKIRAGKEKQTDAVKKGKRSERTDFPTEVKEKTKKTLRARETKIVCTFLPVCVCVHRVLFCLGSSGSLFTLDVATRTHLHTETYTTSHTTYTVRKLGGGGDFN